MSTPAQPRPVMHFVAGLPRSGSTLLMNLLAQNHRHHVTATNGLADLVLGLRDGWMRNPAFQAQGIHTLQHRIVSASRALMHGWYEDELRQGKVVFDKSRAWVAALEILDALFPDEKVPVIVTVRDIRSVVASFERLYRKNPMTRAAFGPQMARAATTSGRADLLLSDQGVVGSAVNRIRDAMNRDPDRLVIVPYRALTTDPRSTMAYIHQRLGLPNFVYDPDHVQQVTQEDDAVHGWGPQLHQIQQKVRPPDSETPWDDVLPPQLATRLEKTYPGINGLARLQVSFFQDEEGQQPPAPISEERVVPPRIQDNRNQPDVIEAETGTEEGSAD